MNKNQLDTLLVCIADLIQVIQEHKGSISENLTPEVYQELERLEKAIELFDETNRQEFKVANINIEALRDKTTHSSHVSPKDKALLERAKQIERDAKQLKLQFSLAIERVNPQRDAQRKQIKERRKKFKTLGNEKGWIPL